MMPRRIPGIALIALALMLAVLAFGVPFSAQVVLAQAADSVEADRAALVALYNATNGDNWTNNENWLSDQPLNEWYGVTTNEEGSVTELDLSQNRLSGPIPPQMGNLSNLERLNLANNDLTGGIPVELGNLSNLERLYLTNNDLTGGIPVELGNLSNLRGLWLGFNQLLTGAIPPQLGSLSNLEWLILHDNQLTGAIPSELGSLSNLQELYIHENQLTGPLPQSFTSLTALQEFAFNNNVGLCAPTGAAFQSWLQAIPNNREGVVAFGPNFGPNCAPQSPDRAALVALYNATDGDNWTNNTNWLSDQPLNEWYGVTTNEEGSVTGLNLPTNNLTGAIPSELGSLSNLQRLWLHGNQLTGAIPSELGNLSNLQYLYLSNNQLTGAIPSELGNLSNLQYLYLSNNQLTGAIPSELGNLSNLQGLDLRSNQLTGAIPSELGNLSNLQYLYLRSNQLTGAIPSELGNLSNLQGLDLLFNQLTGAIPQSFTSLTALEVFGFGNNAGLCAPPDAAFQAWLQAIPARDAGPNCGKATVPDVPGNLSATPGDGQVRLSWQTPADGGSPITGYQYSSGGDTWAAIPNSAPGQSNANSYTVTGLRNGTAYTFRVRAVNGVGSGTPSNQGSATPQTAATAPGAPGNLSATPGDGQVRLSWQTPADGSSPITGYQYSSDSRSWRGIPNSAPGQSNANSYTVTGLRNGTAYTFRVRAVNGVGSGTPSNQGSATPQTAATAPGAPGNLSATPGDGQVRLSWQTPADGGSPITGYQYSSGGDT